MGFSQAGPYYAWMQAVERHEDENPGFELVNELGFLPGEVLMLGMSYLGEDFLTQTSLILKILKGDSKLVWLLLDALSWARRRKRYRLL